MVPADRAAGPDVAGRYARHLLATLDAPAPPLGPFRSAADAWAESGLMHLTGRADGAPLMCPAPLAACADAALAAFRAVAGDGTLAGIDGAALLAERAQLAGFVRAGRVSPGGACRLLLAEDGWLALSLARPADFELLPAFGADPDWASVARAVRQMRVADAVARGRLLGLAIAADVPPAARPWQRSRQIGMPAVPAERPLVVDLSALWAGPLATHLLHQAGARVIKVESTTRPDGARAGPADFFDLLNAGKQSVALDLTQEDGRAWLRRLLRVADIVLEASRPRALVQMGIDARALLAERPGLTWLRLTAYGAAGPAADWIGYGDDVGVACGLSHLLRGAVGKPVFCADAPADALTGLHVALAGWCAWRQGGGRLIELSLFDCLSHAIGFAAPDFSPGLPAADPGTPRRPAARAAPLGADTASVLAEFAC